MTMVTLRTKIVVMVVMTVVAVVGTTKKKAFRPFRNKREFNFQFGMRYQLASAILGHNHNMIYNII